MGTTSGEFIPARTVPEALARIFGLTGRAPASTRGEKRALVALRDALDLDVEVARTNAVTGALIAGALGVDWDPSLHTLRNTVTLPGLNALLRGASAARAAGSLRQLRDSSPDTLSGPEWDAFQPARTKIEAVTRIAALTAAPPETLGPGAKERKSVLVNLAQNLPLCVDVSLSKTRLGAAIADRLNVPWTDMCASTGETISLQGLNTILAGAERHLDVLGQSTAGAFLTAREEGRAITSALRSDLPPRWEGRECVTWLAEEGLRGSNDNEWQGFYGEEQARIALARAFPPPVAQPRVRFGNTVFDYALNFVWDIKVHTGRHVTSTGTVPRPPGMLLNDERAIRECVAQQGLGFIVITGDGLMDESGDFVAWHRAFKADRGGRPPAPSNSGRSRQRKSAFALTEVETFWIPNTSALEAAVLSGSLVTSAIGRQAPRVEGGSGAPRQPKLSMHVERARRDLVVSQQSWPA